MNELVCNCGNKMDMVEQNHKKSMVELKFECSCGNTGLILIRENESYDEYIYDKDKNLLAYNNY